MESMNILNNYYDKDYYKTHKVTVQEGALKSTEGRSTSVVTSGVKKLTFMTLGKDSSLQKIAKVFQNEFDRLQNIPRGDLTSRDLNDLKDQLTHLEKNAESLVNYRDETAWYGGATEKGLGLTELVPQIRGIIATLGRESTTKETQENREATERLRQKAAEDKRLKEEDTESNAQTIASAVPAEHREAVKDLAHKYFVLWKDINKKDFLDASPVANFKIILEVLGAAILVKLDIKTREYSFIEILKNKLDNFRRDLLDFDNTIEMWDRFGEDGDWALHYTLDLVSETAIPVSKVLETLSQIEDTDERHDFSSSLRMIFEDDRKPALGERTGLEIMNRLLSIPADKRADYAGTAYDISQKCELPCSEIFMLISDLDNEQMTVFHGQVKEHANSLENRNVNTDEFLYMLNQARGRRYESIKDKSQIKDLGEAIRLLTEIDNDAHHLALGSIVSTPSEQRTALATLTAEICKKLNLKLQDVLSVIGNFNSKDLEKAREFLKNIGDLKGSYRDKLGILNDMRNLIVPQSTDIDDIESAMRRDRK